MRSLLTICLLISATASAQVDHARKVTETLCSPGFHGRGYVNGGDSIAAEFIASEFKDAGCKFFKTGAFQSFSFPVNTFPGRMSFVVDGVALKAGSDFVVDPGSGGGEASGLALVELTQEEILDSKLRHKKFSSLVAESGRSKTSFGLVIYLPALHGDTLKKARQVAREMTAYCPVIEVVDTKFTWSVDQEQTVYPYFQVQQSVFDMTKGAWKIDLAVDAVLKQHTARNVMAYARAKKRSKKYVVFTAHYDHLGRMGQEAYFPGGNDNASGTAMLLELARYFVENPIGVNVVFMSFAGEEAGLIGSRYYVENPVFPLEKINFLTNVDIMGSGEDGVTIVNATLFPKQFELLTNINKKEELLVKVASRGAAANSDHYFFTQAGVPAFFMYTMGPNKHYHDVNDTYEELSFAEFGDIFKLLIDFGTALPRK